MGRKFDVVKFVDGLPREAELIIRDTYCPDTNKEVKDLTVKELVHEINWAIEKVKMDLYDAEDAEREYFSVQIVEIRKALKRLERLKQ